MFLRNIEGKIDVFGYEFKVSVVECFFLFIFSSFDVVQRSIRFFRIVFYRRRELDDLKVYAREKLLQFMECKLSYQGIKDKRVMMDSGKGYGQYIGNIIGVK